MTWMQAAITHDCSHTIPACKARWRKVLVALAWTIAGAMVSVTVAAGVLFTNLFLTR